MIRAAQLATLALSLAIVRGAAAEPAPDEDAPVARPPAEADADGSDEDTAPLQAAAEIIEIIDRAPRAEPGAAALSAAEARRIPGVQNDALKAARVMPGVARAPLGSGELVVWGAAPGDTRLEVDGMPVPRLFHLGGTTSVVPSQRIGSLSLIPGGAGAAHGRALGGLVRVRSAGPIEAPAGAFASLDALAASAGAHAALGPRGWAAAAARWGLIGETFGAAAGAAAADEAELLVPLPQSWDYHAAVRHELASGERLHLIALGAGDRLERGIPSTTADRAFSETRTARFHRLGIRWLRPTRDAATPSVFLWLGIDDDGDEQVFGDVVARSAQRSLRLGLVASEHRRLADWAALDAGLDLELEHARHAREGALTLPGREGDITVFGQPPGNRVNADRWTVLSGSVAGYASATLRAPGTGLTLAPGLRLEPVFVSGDRVLPVRPAEPAVGYTDIAWALDPRLRLDWRASRGLRVFTAVGRHTQAAAAADLSPVFGNPRLPPARATQLTAGAELELGALELSLAGFGTRSRSLAVRSPAATPPLARLLQATGQARNLGLQLTAELRLARVRAWVSYTLSRAERRLSEDAGWRRFDADQPHVAQAVIGWRWGRRLDLGLRAHAASGAPRTPVVGAVFDTATGNYDPVFGAHNGARLPAFVELSARIAWSHELAWGHCRLWLEVVNLTNRSNVEELFYTADYTRRGAIRGLPIMPLAGAELRL